MNSLFKPEILYIVLLFVIPGVISQSVFNSLVARGNEKSVDVYQYILHSIVVYILLYPLIVLFCGHENINSQSIQSLIVGSSWRPLAAVLIVGLFSVTWGIVYSRFYRSQRLKNFLKRFGEAYEPPNLYAALMVEKYQGDHLGSAFWITLKKDDCYIEGRVEDVAVEKEPREIFIKSVAFLDSNRDVIDHLDSETGMMIKIDEFDIVEITEIKPSNQLS